MGDFFRWAVGKLIIITGFKFRLLYVHPPIASTQSFVGLKKVDTFSLRTGQWIVFAKASAKGSGGNDGLTDCRLKIVGSEGGVTASDESYGAPAPLLGTTMTVMLPFNVVSSADFYLEAGVQGAPAEFVHMVITAVRDATTA